MYTTVERLTIAYTSIQFPCHCILFTHQINSFPTYLDLIWDFICGALTVLSDSRLQYTASRSAQGFLAVPLCSLVEDGQIDELIRLHVWLPDSQRGKAELAIHACQPFAQSWVLSGHGTDYRYEVERADDINLAMHAECVTQWSDSKQASSAYKTHQTSSTVTTTAKLVRVTQSSSEVHTRNISYSIPAGISHKSVVPGNVLQATLFYFDAQCDFFKDASVLGPNDGQSYTQLRALADITPLDLVQATGAARLQKNSKDIIIILWVY